MSTENLRESIVNKLWADTELHHEDAGPIADAVLDLVAARLSEVEAERDALQRHRDEVWHRIDLWSDDPDTGLDHLLDVWASHEKALAQVEAWRPIVEAAIAYRDARYTAQAGAAGDRLVAAVDALPTRNVDSTTPGDTDG